MVDDIDGVTALIEVFRTAWANRDTAAFRSIWDPERELVYCPAELDRPLQGADAVGRYFDRVVADIRHVHAMTVSDVRIEVIGDVAWVFFAFDVEGSSGSAEPFEVHGRNTLIARRTGAGWKGIHYHESLRGPVVVQG
ncbi:nuclear transport factor 2 family protein [Saccharopolyspora oryzae]|uniref:Nuclear transport factor 2 family protein n=1 Tax=Saccharopolyspora oryzae TaxID=2997343 RepID=A0ABT4UZA0_9PSEU|nr:nuclear transport factor 2 family protein [Saccharopolyspora oryzae]MDA3627038.1 nuclear transport factor 2 family protein [Saccharopolyspora oryzae]